MIDPLPSAHLHNTMQEFIPKFPEGVFKRGTALGRLVAFVDDDKDADTNAEAEAEEEKREVGVDVEWVLGVR
jgi:hypothetical protein